MAGSVLGNRTRNFVLRLVVNGCKFTQSEVPNGTALPLVIEKLRKLRAHARSISASSSQNSSIELQGLVWEVAYEHWHRMLFARFLAENKLLMWEPGAAVSLDDCRDMVDIHPDMAMGAKTKWELAGKLANRKIGGLIPVCRVVRRVSLQRLEGSKHLVSRFNWFPHRERSNKEF